MEVMDICAVPVSPNDTNKENILISENTSTVGARSNSVAELMDYSDESDSGKVDSVDMLSTVPSSQETRILLSDNSDSEVTGKVKSNTCSEPEDGELTYEAEDILFPDNSENWESWQPVRVSPEKLAARAKRFGLNSSSVPVPKEELLKLYESLDIPLNLVRSGKLKHIRLNTLHMRGVQEMNTTDVIKYFEKYEPMSIEWINDFSCNIIFPSDTAAAKAIMEMSTEIVIESEEAKESADKKNSEKAAENLATTDLEVSKKSTNDASLRKGKSSVAALFETPVPPGKWRQGCSCDKAKSILLRFASKDDRKIRGAEKRSMFYQKYGNPNYGGLTGLITNSRKQKYASSSRRNSDYYLRTGFGTENSSRYFKNSGFRGDIRRNIQYRGRRSTRGRYYYESPLYRTKRELSSDSDDEQNTLSAGGKKIRMRMYADDVEGSWQKVKAASGPTMVTQKPVCQNDPSGFSDNSSDEEQNQHHSATKKDVPSRYKIWNPIAENMAREAELAEKSQGYGFPRYQRSYVDNDLRSKISITSHQSYRQVTKTNDVDLRRKLLFNRRDGRAVLRSPLLISVRNRQRNDSDSSF